MLLIQYCKHLGSWFLFQTPSEPLGTSCYNRWVYHYFVILVYFNLLSGETFRAHISIYFEYLRIPTQPILTSCHTHALYIEEVLGSMFDIKLHNILQSFAVYAKQTMYDIVLYRRRIVGRIRWLTIMSERTYNNDNNTPQQSCAEVNGARSPIAGIASCRWQDRSRVFPSVPVTFCTPRKGPRCIYYNLTLLYYTSLYRIIILSDRGQVILPM